MISEVVLLTGPPGSGKTTIARGLALRSSRSVHLEADSFFHFIVAGYVEPWRRESHEQNQLVLRIVSDAAAAYADGGYYTIVDGIISPGWFFEPIRDALRSRGLRVAYAILRPSLEVAVTRAKGRGPTTREPDEAVIKQLWASFDHLGGLERHVVDSGELTEEETVSEVEARLQRGSLDIK